MEEMMRKMQNMGKAQFMEETRKIRSAWVEEAVKRCSPMRRTESVRNFYRLQPSFVMYAHWSQKKKRKLSVNYS